MLDRCSRGGACAVVSGTASGLVQIRAPPSSLFSTYRDKGVPPTGRMLDEPACKPLPYLICVASWRVVACQVEINELGEIAHLSFYDFTRFEKLNTSAGADLVFAYFERLKSKQS